MHNINIYTYYFIGKMLAPLSATRNKMTHGELFIATMGAPAAIELLISQATLPIRATDEAARDLRAAIDAVLPKNFGVPNNFDDPVSLADLHTIQTALERLEVTLSREAGFAHVYSVSPKGILDIHGLVDSAEASLGSMAGRLADLAVYDFRQSGRCLAFDLPTAAAFHLLRAAETTIKTYYKKLTEKNWGEQYKESQRNWGQYIKALIDAGAKPTITAALQQIKDLYRNPIVHPEAQLETDEAIALFGQVQGVILLMLKEIHGPNQEMKG